MKRLLTLFSCLLFIVLCTGTALADPITLLAGQSVNYSGTTVATYPGGAFRGSSSITFNLSTDGTSLTISVLNRGGDSPSGGGSGDFLLGINFNAISSTGIPLLSSPISTAFKYSSFPGSTVLWSAGASTSGSNNYFLSPGLSYMQLGTNGTTTFSLTSGPVQSLTLDNIVSAYPGGNNAFGIPSSVTPPTTSPVPEPATLALLSTGLGALVLRVRKRKNISQD
jgi:hypothetical protein